jgi:hypothetical protein
VKTTTEVIVEEIMFKTKLIEMTTSEIADLRAELAEITRPSKDVPVYRVIDQEPDPEPEPAPIRGLEPLPAPERINIDPKVRDTLHLNFMTPQASETPEPDEVFRPIPGASDYDISNLARVRSRRSFRHKIMLGNGNRHYRTTQVTIVMDDGTSKCFSLKRLMREVWPDIVV